MPKEPMTDAGVSFVSHRSSGRKVDEARKMLLTSSFSPDDT